MTAIWLNYTDDYGDTKRVSVQSEIFTVGRQPQNDLCIPDNRLSREHVRFELYSDKFYVSDSGSSNGTTLNGAPLNSSVALNDGDRLNLGGAVEIKIETDSGNAYSYQSPAVENQYSPNEEKSVAPIIETPMVAANSARAPASDLGGIPKIFLIMVPIFVLTILIVIGTMFFLLGGKNKKEIAQEDDIPIYTPKSRTPDNGDLENATPTPKKTDSPTGTSNSTLSSPDSNSSLPTPPKTSGDVEKVEQNGNLFLRRIAQNDPRAFLTTKQSEMINSKISQFKGSTALAENLKAVKKNAAQFESLASSKNLKAQFLATAALAKIGNNRGDPLAVANQMLPFLNDLKITLDNKLADDNLMIIAAYERGAAGKPRSLQSTLEALSKTTQNVGPREIRTIWFLKNAGKITDAEFNFALQFLAIGAITQNPKDFNVNTDAVTFD